MGFLVSEPHDLVLDRRAITRTDPLDMPPIHCRAIEIVADDLVGLFVGMRNSAGNLADLRPLRQEGKHHRIVISRLAVEDIPVDRLPVQPGRRSGFQTSKGQAELRNAFRQQVRGLVTHPSTWALLVTDMDDAMQEGACGQHNRASRDRGTILQPNTCNAPIDHHQIGGLAFKNAQVGQRRQLCLHGKAIELAVRLGPRPLHGRPLAAIEKAKLDARRIGDAPHGPTKRVNFTNKVALPEAADGGIAGHHSDRVGAQG